MRFRASHTVRAVVLTLLSLCTARSALAQLNENCTISVLNRNVRVRPDGSWVLPNIPANFGPVRARVTCIIDGQTVSGESDPFLVPANGVANRPHITFGKTTPIPTFVSVIASPATLTQIGVNAQLTVTAHYSDGSAKDVTASTGTQYTISNPAIATISDGGVVHSLQSGTVLIQATHEGASGLVSIRVAPPGADTDHDGIPDDYELAHGLDPNNAVDAQEDPDHDGLTNLQEYQLGTDPHNPDTDGDGLKDGDEVNIHHTNPLLWDSDGDGISDGLEVQTGSNPLDATSQNLAGVLSAIHVAPGTFGLTFNTIVGEASRQLLVTGDLRDGRSLNLTSTSRGTNYTSSDLAICSFGGTDGAVFAGQSGTCTITVSNNGFTATATGHITNFSPTALGSVAIPGYANNVDANGNTAYVAAGAAGLVVVDASNPSAPQIVATLQLDTRGNANDVRVVGNLAYVADGAAGLQIVDVSNPRAPRLLGSLDTTGEANDVIVSGNLAFVADGPSGLQIINVADPTRPTLVRTVATPGTARGVDVGGQIVVVADDLPQPGLRVIDVSDPAHAAIVGSVTLSGQPTDVSLGGGFAYVAAYTGGVSIVDVRQPTVPTVVSTLPGSSPGGFVPRDVQVAGQFAIFAEQLFATAVAPIVDVSTPSAPRFRAVLDFGQDYAGTGIAVSGPYVYWTGQSFFVGSENGTNGNTRLFIGQYLAREDRAGVPPTVAITAPSDGSTVIEGMSVTARATATDDVAVSLVSFTVDGQVTFVDTSEPYEYTFTVPTGVTTLLLGATATDLGDNLGTAPTVALSVIPDPLTTVVGRVVDKQGQPLAGATVIVLAHAGVTGADGTFSITGVPTLQPFLVVSASLTQDTTVLTGSSAPTAPVRAGTTDVGDIVAAGTTFETELGALVARCDDCSVTSQIPFPFPFGGTTVQQVVVSNNGYVSFPTGGSLEAFSSDLNDDLGNPASGLYVNNQLPGRLVVTWFRELEYYQQPGPITIQLILFSDGRIQFGYHGVAPGYSAQVGLFPPNTSISTAVDFSANPNLNVGAQEAVYENFNPNGHPFDLDGGFVIFAPSPIGGYQIHPVPDATPPTCSITSPADGSTLFEGEPIQVAANATDNGNVSHVTLKSTVGGLDADLVAPPFSAAFVVPVGATQITFNAKAFDGWGNTGACTSTVSVVSGPPPAITITSPSADAVLTEGATITVAVDATNRVPVSRVDLAVNGVALSTDTAAPYEFLFTVPAGVTSLAMSVSAINTVGKTGTSGPVNVTVAPDARTTVQGRVLNQVTAPVSGAQVTADVHGASAEIFNLGTPLPAWPPDLTGRTPDRVAIVSAVNLRNPGALFGADPFSLGGSGGHVTRFTANVQTTGANTYTFKLGVNERGLLKVNGVTVVDIPTSTGQFQEATSAMVAVPAGSIAIEILTVDNGNLEVQLSYAAQGDDMKVVPPGGLTPAITPYQTTSDAAGTFAFAAFPTILGDVVARASAVIDGRTARGRSLQVPPVPAGTTDVGDIRLSGGKVALIHCDSTAAIRAGLASTGLIPVEDLTDINACGAAPSLADLSGFGGVLVWSNYSFGQPQALGDVLANFVDQGGGVVLATYAFSSVWRIGGRITTDGYSPFNVFGAGVSTSGRLDLANSNTNHPILEGVTPTQSVYFTNGNYTNPALTPGSALIAVDTGGNNVVAVNGNNRVVGVSIFPGFTVPAEIARLFANAINFVR